VQWGDGLGAINGRNVSIYAETNKHISEVFSMIGPQYSHSLVLEIW
jgi:hypothetical protein